MSPSFVRDLSRRFRSTGSVAAKPPSGGQKLKADAKTIRRLEALVARHNNMTYVEYRRRLCPKGATLSRASMGRLLLRLDLTRKKTLNDHETSSQRVEDPAGGVARADGGRGTKEPGLRGRERR